MSVTMVQVGKVRMAMAHWVMAMAVGMRFRAFIAAMGVLVVRVMNMAMLVVQRFVLVLMPVPLGKDEPCTHRGQEEGGAERRGERLAEERDGKRGAEERRGTEMGSGARCAEMTQCEDIKHEASAVAESAHDKRR
jgi:hypothetical protein